MDNDERKGFDDDDEYDFWFILEQFGFNSGSNKMEKHETPYKVPSSKGGFLSAEPVQFCLRYKPPTIALVYEIIRKQKD